MGAAAVDTKISPLPDIGDIIFILMLEMLLVGIPHFLFGDGSTGWHLVFRRLDLGARSCSHADIISYTFAGNRG